MLGESVISILTVNWNGLEWLKLLVASIRRFSSTANEMLVIDNASQDGSREWLGTQKDVRTIFLDANLGHGRGADLAVNNAAHKLCLLLDSDAHIMRRGYEADLQAEYETGYKTRLIAARGGPEKPIHPCIMFFERDYFIDNKLSLVPREGYDVGRKLWPDILALGHETRTIPVGYEGKERRKFYPGTYGDTYYLEDKPIVYHSWYASRMWKKEQVDNLTRQDFDKHKELLFQQPLVKEILGT